MQFPSDEELKKRREVLKKKRQRYRKIYRKGKSDLTKLQLLRLLEGRNLKEIALLSEYNQSSARTIHNVERGRLPASKTLRSKLSELFEVPPKILFNGNNYAVKINRDLKKKIKELLIQEEEDS